MKMEEATPASKMVESTTDTTPQFTWVRDGVGFSVAADRLAPILRPIDLSCTVLPSHFRFMGQVSFHRRGSDWHLKGVRSKLSGTS
jgi:hypothetical protein